MHANLVAAPAASAVAQEQQEANENIMLEEVTVTARKREENIQEVPVAVSVITGELLEDQGVADLVAGTREQFSAAMARKGPCLIDCVVPTFLS